MLRVQLFLPWLGLSNPPVSTALSTAVAAAARRVFLDRGPCPGWSGTVCAARQAGLREGSLAALRLGGLQGLSLSSWGPMNQRCAPL